MFYYFNKQDLATATQEDLSPVLVDETHFFSDSGEELVIMLEDLNTASYTSLFETSEELNSFLDENSDDWSSRDWMQDI